MIEVLCQGSPREMGRTQGVALRQKIHDARRALSELEAFRISHPWWLPYQAYRSWAEYKAWHALAGPLATHHQELSERLAGLAEGAELSAKAVYLLNALEPLLSSISNSTACPGGCSAVAVRGRRSATGEPIIARNFDYLPLVQPFYTIRASRPLGKLRLLEFTAAPLAGTVDGINEAGLCITYNYAFPIDAPSGSAVPISMLLCEALQQCGTVQAAADFLAAQERWGGGLLMLADAAGDLASLELSNTRSQLRRPEAGEDVLFHTNGYTGPMREIEIPQDAIYSDASPRPLRGRRVHLSTERRNQRFEQLLSSREVFSQDDLAAIMSDHGPDGKPDDFTPCVHGSYWYTTASLQYFPRARKMRASFSNACQAQYKELAL